METPIPEELDRHVTVRVAVDRPERPLRDYLASRIRKVRPEDVERWFREGRITLPGGTVVDPRMPVRSGSVFHIRMPVPAHRRPEPMELEVVHEDRDLIAISKPSGVVVHPSRGHVSGTIYNALLHRYGADARIHIVHRLDRDTSGILVVARTVEAGGRLARAFGERAVRKLYYALVEGDGPGPTWIDAPIARDPRDPIRWCVRPDGRPARTFVRTVQRFPGPPNYSLLEVLPRTGRTHQIRLHLAALGLPIAADAEYHPEPDRAHREHGLPLERVGLHAAMLELPHPDDGAPLSLSAPLALDLQESVRRLSREASG